MSFKNTCRRSKDSKPTLLGSTKAISQLVRQATNGVRHHFCLASRIQPGRPSNIPKSFKVHIIGSIHGNFHDMCPFFSMGEVLNLRKMLLTSTNTFYLYLIFMAYYLYDCNMMMTWLSDVKKKSSDCSPGGPWASSPAAARTAATAPRTPGRSTTRRSSRRWGAPLPAQGGAKEIRSSQILSYFDHILSL